MQQKNLCLPPHIPGNCIYTCTKITAQQLHFGVHLLSPSYPTISGTVKRMLSEDLDKNRPRLMSPDDSLELDLTPAQDALQKSTFWN